MSSREARFRVEEDEKVQFEHVGVCFVEVSQRDD